MKNILKFIRQSLHNRKCAAVCGDDDRYYRIDKRENTVLIKTIENNEKCHNK